MIARVCFINGQWFGYGRTRVLGPFKTERQAWRALQEENEL
jgi:hypothetical protein